MEKTKAEAIVITEANPKNQRYKLGVSELILENYNNSQTNSDTLTGRGIIIYTLATLEVNEVHQKVRFEETIIMVRNKTQ